MKIHITWRLLPQAVLAIGLLRGVPAGELDEGAAHLRAGRLAEAERSFRRGLIEEPKNARLWKFLGMSLSGREKLAEAEEAFGKACDLDRGEENACYYLGRARTTLGQFDGARAAFAKAPATARLSYGRGLLAQAEGDGRAAEGYLRRAFDGGEAAALPDLALLLAGEGRVEEARSLSAKIADAQVRERLLASLRMASPSATAAAVVEPRFVRQPLAFQLLNGAVGRHGLPETMLGGTAIFDFDNDGLQDLFLSNGRGPSALYRNLGNRKFADVSAAMEVPSLVDAMGVAGTDFDNDGFVDLLLTSLNGPRLYRNDGGRRFLDETRESGLDAESGWSVAGAVLDYDRDGWQDLFLVRYVRYDAAREERCQDAKKNPVYCHPSLYRPHSNLLYRNVGGRFVDVSAAAGIARHMGKGMGAAVGDANGDGWLDVFVANDTMPNFLFVNDGKGGFSESAVNFGVALRDDGKPVSSMGVDFRDLDNDGWEDLAVTALSDESFPLFRNLGGMGFADVGLGMRTVAATMPFSGWGIGIYDFNNDGFKDIFTANGHVQDNLKLSSSRRSKQENLVLVNRSGRYFSPLRLSGAGMHRGAAFGDLDGDGRIDVLVSALNERAFILWNETPRRNWVAFRAPLGTRVTVEAGGLTQTNRLSTSSGYGASSQALIHFGLGSAHEIGRLTVEFPSRSSVQVAAPEINGVHTLRPSAGQPL